MDARISHTNRKTYYGVARQPSDAMAPGHKFGGWGEFSPPPPPPSRGRSASSSRASGSPGSPRRRSGGPTARSGSASGRRRRGGPGDTSPSRTSLEQRLLQVPLSPIRGQRRVRRHPHPTDSNLKERVNAARALDDRAELQRLLSEERALRLEAQARVTELEAGEVRSITPEDDMTLRLAEVMDEMRTTREETASHIHQETEARAAHDELLKTTQKCLSEALAELEQCRARQASGGSGAGAGAGAGSLGSPSSSSGGGYAEREARAALRRKENELTELRSQMMRLVNDERRARGRAEDQASDTTAHLTEVVSEKREVDRELKAARQENARLRQQVSSLQADILSLQDSLETSRTINSEQRTRISELNSAISQVRTSPIHAEGARPGSSASASASAAASSGDDAEHELSELREQLAVAKSALSRCQSDRAELRRTCSDLERSSNTLTATIRDCHTRITELEAQLAKRSNDSSSQEIERLRAALSEARAQVSEANRARHETELASNSRLRELNDINAEQEGKIAELTKSLSLTRADLKTAKSNSVRLVREEKEKTAAATEAAAKAVAQAEAAAAAQRSVSPRLVADSERAKSRAEAQLKSLREELAAAKTAEAAAVREIATLKTTLKKARANERDSVRSSAVLSKTAKDAKEEVDRLSRELSETTAECDTTKAELRSLQKRISSLQEKVDSAGSASVDQEARLAELETRNLQLEGELKESQEAQTALRTSLDASQSEANDLRDLASSQTSSTSKLESELTDANARIKALEARSKSSSASEGAAQAQVNALNNKLKQQTEELDQLKLTLERMKAEHQASTDQADTELSKLKEQVAANQSVLAELNETRSKLTTAEKAARDGEEAQRRVTELERSLASSSGSTSERIAELEAALNKSERKSGILESTGHQLQKRISDESAAHVEEREKLEAQLKALQGEIDARDERIVALEQQLTPLRSCPAQREAAESRVVELERLLEQMRTSREAEVEEMSTPVRGDGAGAGEDSFDPERSPDNLVGFLKESSEDADSVTLASGRVVPMYLLDGGDMVSVSHALVMRVILRNQTGVNKLFAHYADAGEHMSLEAFMSFASELSIYPDFCNTGQLKEVFILVNASEAGDGESDLLDQEEFIESLVRIGAYYSPGDFDLSVEKEIAAAFVSLLMHMNEQPKGKELGLHFVAGKR